MVSNLVVYMNFSNAECYKKKKENVYNWINGIFF